MTSENLVTVPVGTTLDEAQERPAPPPDREASGRRRRRVPEGPDHGQGHPEEDPVPARDEGRAGPAAGRRRRRRRHGRARAGRGAGRGGGRRARRRHLARPLAGRRRDGAQDQAPSYDVQVVAGNIATAEAAEALIDAGADAVKVGHRPGVDLHDARRRRGRRAADHGDLRLRAGRGPLRRARSSPTAASSSRATSPRRSRPAPSR